MSLLLWIFSLTACHCRWQEVWQRSIKGRTTTTQCRNNGRHVTPHFVLCIGFVTPIQCSSDILSNFSNPPTLVLKLVLVQISKVYSTVATCVWQQKCHAGIHPLIIYSWHFPCQEFLIPKKQRPELAPSRTRTRSAVKKGAVETQILIMRLFDVGRVCKVSSDPPRPAMGSLHSNEMAGYLPWRGEFQVEYQDSGEFVIQDLSFDDTNTVLERGWCLLWESLSFFIFYMLCCRAKPSFGWYLSGYTGRKMVS